MSGYVSGPRVRIKAGVWPRDAFSNMWQYDGLTGRIVSVTPLIAYRTEGWTKEFSRPFELIPAYKVLLDLGIEVDNVTDDYLESTENL